MRASASSCPPTAAAAAALLWFSPSLMIEWLSHTAARCCRCCCCCRCRCCCCCCLLVVDVVVRVLFLSCLLLAVSRVFFFFSVSCSISCPVLGFGYLFFPSFLPSVLILFLGRYLENVRVTAGWLVSFICVLPVGFVRASDQRPTHTCLHDDACVLRKLLVARLGGVIGGGLTFRPQSPWMWRNLREGADMGGG
ncbi:unnamed protein product, partial [Laminaria digitata]